MIAIEKDTWKSEVLDSDKPVLVDFWAEWCAPCRALTPVLEELSQELAEKLKVVKVNVDSNQELAGQFGIRSIPTLLVMKNGQVQEQMVGMASKDQLTAKLEPYLG